MIVWKGKGILAPILVIGLIFLFNYIVKSIFGDNYLETHQWPVGVSLIISGILVWYLGKMLNRHSEMVYMDEVTGEQKKLGPQNTLFFIRMEYWAPVALLGGIYLIIQEFI